jgi:cation transport ATPase
MSYYVHNVPGRLRVKTPTLRSMAGGEERVSEFFDHLEGVERVSVNSLTGSVVVHYDPEVLESEEILEVLKRRGHFDESMAFRNQGYQEQAISKTAQTVGKVLVGWAVGKALENSGLSFLTALIQR